MKQSRKVSARMISDRWVHLIDNLTTEIHNGTGYWDLTGEQLLGDIDLLLEPEEWDVFDKINHILSVPTLRVRTITHKDYCFIDIGLDLIVSRLDEQWKASGEREGDRDVSLLDKRNEMRKILWLFENEADNQNSATAGQFTIALTEAQWALYDREMGFLPEDGL